MVVILTAMVVAVALPAAGQETSVRPGINDPYVEPDLAEWVGRLEGENRAIFQYRHAIVATLALDEGDEVADVGAGTGFLTRLMAEEVGPEGKVYAVDVVPEFIEHIRERAAKEGLTQIETVTGEPRSTKLATDSVDVVLVCDTYHHFEYPEDSLASIREALRPGGTLVVIDFERVEGVSPPFAIGHVRAGKGTVTDEVKDAGFDLVREIPLMEQEGQYYLVFRER
jgi:ubiquinone/menaquinone biosynthesis C-methylase UbiE